jgi:hypothetical protein
MTMKAYVKSALYVDFDNVHSNLEHESPDAAHAFVTNPAAWLAWFMRGGHDPSGEFGAEAAPRRMLVRRCYGSPWKFGKYRLEFVRAGFSVIDCPPLTSRGKNCADIQMAVDILDALEHPTRFEEFIILSSDADFTPILTRIREHDRRSTIITNAVAAAPLKAACDCAISEVAFGCDALGVIPHAELRERVRLATEEALEQSPDGEMLLGALGNKLPKDVRDELRESNYCGCGGLRALLESGKVGGDYKLSRHGTDYKLSRPGGRLAVAETSRRAECADEADADETNALVPEAA